MIFVAVFLFWFHYCRVVFVFISVTVWNLVIICTHCCSRWCLCVSCNSHIESKYIPWATLKDWSFCWTQTVFSVRVKVKFCMQFRWSYTFFLYSWFRASWLYINNIQRDATVCRCLFTAKLLYMLRVSIALIVRSTSNSNCSFWYRPRWRQVVAQTSDMTCTRSCSYSLMYSWWRVR